MFLSTGPIIFRPLCDLFPVAVNLLRAALVSKLIIAKSDYSFLKTFGGLPIKNIPFLWTFSKPPIPPYPPQLQAQRDFFVKRQSNVIPKPKGLPGWAKETKARFIKNSFFDIAIGRKKQGYR